MRVLTRYGWFSEINVDMLIAIAHTQRLRSYPAEPAMPSGDNAPPCADVHQSRVRRAHRRRPVAGRSSYAVPQPELARRRRAAPCRQHALYWQQQ